jgi:ribosomal protein L7Ae-like RNA K-turn-binding protein
MGYCQPEKWKALLGLGFCGGKVITGTEAVWSALEHRRASLVILAEDASERTKADFCRLSEKVGIPWILLSEKEILGKCTGQSPRAVLAVIDKQMAKAILRVVVPEKISENG